MKLPNLFIPGFGKCGTTTTGVLLGQHPDIELPDEKALHWHNATIKEPGFFIAQPAMRMRATERAFVGDRKYRLDGSPYYSLNPSSLKLIKRECENPKAIVLMRDPANRALSLWNHYLQAYDELEEKFDIWGMNGGFTFGEQLRFENENGPAGILRGGTLPASLRLLIRTFGRQNIHFAFLEELENEPNPYFSAIFDFLGIPDQKIKLQTLNSRDYCFRPEREDIVLLRQMLYNDLDEIRAIVGRIPASWGQKTRFE